MQLRLQNVCKECSTRKPDQCAPPEREWEMVNLRDEEDARTKDEDIHEKKGLTGPLVIFPFVSEVIACPRRCDHAEHENGRFEDRRHFFPVTRNEEDDTESDEDSSKSRKNLDRSMRNDRSCSVQTIFQLTRLLLCQKAFFLPIFQCLFG